MAETTNNDNVVVAENMINANDKENSLQSTDATAKDTVKEVEQQQPQVDAHVTGTPMDTDETAAAASMSAKSKDSGVDKMVEIEMKTIAGGETDQGHEHVDVQKEDECKNTTTQSDMAPVVHEQSQSDVVTAVVSDSTTVEVTATTTMTTIVENETVVTTVVEEKVDEKIVECVAIEEVARVVDDQHMGDDEPQAKIAKVISPVLATVAKDADAAAAGVDKIQMLGNQHIQNTRSYLDQTLVPILLEALAAAARARPADAIAFVAEFLMKNKERFDKKIAMDMQQQKGLPQ